MQTDSFQCVFAMARGRSCWVGARSVVVDKVKELLYNNTIICGADFRNHGNSAFT